MSEIGLGIPVGLSSQRYFFFFSPCRPSSSMSGLEYWQLLGKILSFERLHKADLRHLFEVIYLPRIKLSSNSTAANIFLYFIPALRSMHQYFVCHREEGFVSKGTGPRRCALQEIHKIHVNCVSIRVLAKGRWHVPGGWLASFRGGSI